MELPVHIFGAKAAIHIRYDGDIRSLAAELSKGLRIPDFILENREDPPHDLMGSAEALGWEIWLEETGSIPTFQFSLKMEAEDSFKEIFDGRIHDLSPWLARFVSKMCKVDTLVSGTRVVFKNGETHPSAADIPETSSPAETHSIILLGKDGKTIPAHLLAWDESPDTEDMVKLSLAFPGQKLETEAEDFFSALIELRKELEKENLLLICYGASLNVYPSGMSRNMGGGEKAYKLTLGQPGLTKDLVSIFDTGPDVKPSRIDEQGRFYLDWLESLK